jgi:FdhD protein
MMAGGVNLRPSRRGQEPAPQDEGFFGSAEFFHPEEPQSGVSKDDGMYGAELVVTPTPNPPLNGEGDANISQNYDQVSGNSLCEISRSPSPLRGGLGVGVTKPNYLIYRNSAFTTGTRTLAEETAIAISYNGSTHAVLMATPQDLEDFAVGFSLTEGIISNLEAIENIEIVETPLGIDLQVMLAGDVAEKLAVRKRSMAGPVGCGLCGIESLEGAMRQVPQVETQVQFSPQDIADAVAQLSANQPINTETRAVHAAGFYVAGQGLIAVREDVGRHNALDKLIGALVQQGVEASAGAVVLTSRVSVEMVQKTAIAGSGMIIAVSAPTALAVRTADDAGITLAAIVRGPEFEVFTHPHRVGMGANVNVA